MADDTSGPGPWLRRIGPLGREVGDLAGARLALIAGDDRPRLDIWPFLGDRATRPNGSVNVAKMLRVIGETKVRRRQPD